jgi:hypothetical protein
MNMNDYAWQAGIGSFALDWSLQGNEWLHRFTAAIASSPATLVTGYLHDATTQPFIKVTFSENGDLTNTVLLIADMVDSILLSAAGDKPPSDDLHELITTAARAATSTLGEEGDEIAWTALVGPASERIGGQAKRLLAEERVGEMRLVSTERLLLEPDLSQQRSLSSWGVQGSVPILVHGTSRGYNWTAASPSAARRLHTLCGLMSIATDETIIVREAPAPLDWGERQVPPSPPWYKHPPTQDPDHEITDVETFQLPPWFPEALRKMLTTPILVAAADTYLEGCQATPRHPSLAAVAFTASIETIAGRLFKLPHCESCKNRLHLSRSFKEALRIVLDEEEATLLDSVYNNRSLTVHQSLLHGGETTPGVFFTGPWGANTAIDFRWQTLWKLRSAARSLLKWAVTNELPLRVRLPEAQSQ